MASLKYYAGAEPGKKRKLTESERSQKKREYEKKRIDRSFNEKWCQGRSWLLFDKEKGEMRCTECSDFYREKVKVDKNLRTMNTFILGCKNFRASAVSDHEKTKLHERAHEIISNKGKSSQEKVKSQAGRALLKMKSAERDRLQYLFRNAHAIAKNNRPLSDYGWLCEIDKAKQLNVGTTYLNERAAKDFIHSIAKTEKMKSFELAKKNPFFAFMMDGSTDVSGDEQETIYIRSATKGVVTERFLDIGTPNSTKSQDLLEHVLHVFQGNDIDKRKLIAIGSDGASNMTGVRSGLSTLLREKVNPELVNVHCLCHRLELAFRDVVKKVKLYDKLMTLLIGLYYFYKQSYKNKQGLKMSIKAMGKGVFPSKVTGTRWLPHLFRGITALLNVTISKMSY